MGTATFSIAGYAIRNSDVTGAYRTGGAHTTSTTSSALTDGAAGAGTAVSAAKHDVLTIRVDEDARVLFGATPTATSGHLVFANETTYLEITDAGAINIIDVA